jgi:hypothetical protein
MSTHSQIKSNDLNETLLKNAFSLTMHKSQGLTSFNTTILLDPHILTSRQSHVTIDHAKTKHLQDNINVLNK